MVIRRAMVREWWPYWVSQALRPVMLAALVQHLPSRVDSLYDPVHHIESARIYGNIDAFAYYYVDLLIGTPPQRVSVIVDTGSGVTAFPCRSCRHCGTHIDPNFNFEGSSSASWVPCRSGKCKGSCRDGDHCGYHQGYTEGSSITGWYFEDQVHLGDAMQHNPRVPAVMGCHQDENKLFYTQKANGIMGIRPPGTSSPNILDWLFADKAHIDSKVFSLCLADWGGRMVVGGYNASYHKGEVQYIPLKTSSGYYRVSLTTMIVNGRNLGSFYREAMIDSGTTYTYMASESYRALRGAIEDHCKRSNCRATLRGNCWELQADADLSGFPTVEIMFDKVKTNWVPQAYLFKKGTSGNRWCYGFEDDGPRASTVLGASWMLHQEIIFDMRQNKVGIVPANCPEFRKRPEIGRPGDETLNLHGEGPAPSSEASGGAPSAAPAPPTPSAPSPLPKHEPEPREEASTRSSSTAEAEAAAAAAAPQLSLDSLPGALAKSPGLSLASMFGGGAALIVVVVLFGLLATGYGSGRRTAVVAPAGEPASSSASASAQGGSGGGGGGADSGGSAKRRSGSLVIGAQVPDSADEEAAEEMDGLLQTEART